MEKEVAETSETIHVDNVEEKLDQDQAEANEVEQVMKTNDAEEEQEDGSVKPLMQSVYCAALSKVFQNQDSLSAYTLEGYSMDSMLCSDKQHDVLSLASTK